MLYYIPYISPMHPGRVVTTFLGLDAVCEILIAQGAWRMAHTELSEHERQIGADLVTGSLALQTALFGAFGLMAVQFHRRAARLGVLSAKMRTVIIVLYISSTVVTIRCIYRLVEYLMGWDSTIYKNEVFFYIFEAIIMLANTVILNIWHPGKRLPRSNSCFLGRDGVTERPGPGWDDDRPWIVTFFDPFDLCGLIMGRHKGTPFWELPDEELLRLRAEKKANKRPWYALLLDPFHLFGPRGYFGKHFSKPQGSSVPTVRTEKSLEADYRTEAV
jgi:hypothetical protein